MIDLVVWPNSALLAGHLWTGILTIHTLVFSGNLFLKKYFKKWTLYYCCPDYYLCQVYLSHNLGLTSLMLMHWNFCFILTALSLQQHFVTVLLLPSNFFSKCSCYLVLDLGSSFSPPEFMQLFFHYVASWLLLPGILFSVKGILFSGGLRNLCGPI